MVTYVDDTTTARSEVKHKTTTATKFEYKAKKYDIFRFACVYEQKLRERYILHTKFISRGLNTRIEVSILTI